MKEGPSHTRQAERTPDFSEITTVPFVSQTLAEVAEDIAASAMPPEHKVNVLLAIVRAYAGPDALLDYYFMLLGTTVVDAAHAIECAERGEKPRSFALDDPSFGALYTAALSDVREERKRRDASRAYYDRMASALLAATRLTERDRSAVA